MDMIGKIRRLSRRGKKSEREISRMTGLSRNTVAKWLHGELEGELKYRRGAQLNKLTAFHETLVQVLKADAPSASDVPPKPCSLSCSVPATTAANPE